MVWFNVFTSPQEAIAVEKRIKGRKREKKLGLITENNPNFQDLYTVAAGDLDSSPAKGGVRMTS